MTKNTTVFGNLLRYLSRSDFEKAVLGFNGDFRIRKLSCYDLFKAMIYGQAAGCFSVREIETSMNASAGRLYHAGIKQIKRSTFCDALGKRNHEIFKNVFHASVDKAQKISFGMQKKFKSPLRIIDGTIISLCLKRYDWAKYIKAKGAMKLHMNLDGDNLIPFDACLTEGRVHEVEQLPNLCQESGVIYVMDRGFIDYKSLYNIELQKSKFVTRVKSNTVYKRVHNNPQEKGSPILSDVLIVLTGPKTKDHYPVPIRKVKYYDEKTKRTFEFLTNDMERDAQEIAAIYKERWEIEIFFKWIKQHLKIKSFWGTSMNAVYSQIWVALILTILLWINKVMDGIKTNAHELSVMIRTTLLTKNTLIGLCTNIISSKPDYGVFQPYLMGFKC